VTVSLYTIGLLSVLSCPVCLPIMLVYCDQTVGWIKMKLGMKVGLGTGHIVLDRDPSPLLKKWAELPPQFLAHVHCGQTAGWIKTALGTEVVGLGPCHIVLPLPKRAQPPCQFSTHICCGQMTEWIKMLLGMEIGLSPGNFCLRWGPSYPSKKGAEPPPQFSAHVHCGQTAGWIKTTHWAWR